MCTHVNMIFCVLTYYHFALVRFCLWYISALLHTSKVLFLAPSVTCLFVPQISPEQLNGYAPNSHGRPIWSLARTSLNVKVKGQGQGHQGQKTWLALPSPPGSVRMVCTRSRQREAAADGTIPSLRGVILGACVRCMFGKKSLSLVSSIFSYYRCQYQCNSLYEKMWSSAACMFINIQRDWVIYKLRVTEISVACILLVSYSNNDLKRHQWTMYTSDWNYRPTGY